MRAVRKMRHTMWRVERVALGRLDRGRSIPSLFHPLGTSSLSWADSILIHVANRWNTLEVSIGQNSIILVSVCSLRSTVCSYMFHWRFRNGSCVCAVGSLVLSWSPLNSYIGSMRSKIWSRRSPMIMVLGDHPLTSLFRSPTWNMQI